MPGERFKLTLLALPDDVPAAIRLKIFLKRALRSARLRCTAVSELADDAQPPGPSLPHCGERRDS